MYELLVKMLKENGVLGDSKTIKSYTPSIVEGEQNYTVTICDSRSCVELEYTYTNAEILEFLFEQTQSTND